MAAVGHFPAGFNSWYWLGIEAAGNHTFYGVDGTYIGKGLPSNTSPYAHWARTFPDTYSPSTNVGCVIAHTAGLYTSYTGALAGLGWRWGWGFAPACNGQSGAGWHASHRGRPALAEMHSNA